MRLRPYRSESDYEYVEKWVNGERIHALWSANLLPFPLSKEALEAFLERDTVEWGGYAYVATEDDGTPMGFFCYSVNLSDNSGFLKFVLLDPELRGRGHGVQMIRLALKYAFEITGAKLVQLAVFQVNAAAVRCYTKAGFTADSVTKEAFSYRDEKWDRIHMIAVQDSQCRQKLLITGFEPFGGESLNPSWEAVKGLPDRIGRFELMKMQIPTVFGEAARKVLEAAEKIQPDVILCIGQAGGRSMVTPEVVAINLREASIPDNAGNMPQNEPVCVEGTSAYFASVDIRRMAEAVKRCGIPCGLSYSAGVYVCNDLFYTLLHRYSGTKTGVGFIHVPYLPQQAGDEEPSLPLETVIRALVACIEAI